MMGLLLWVSHPSHSCDSGTCTLTILRCSACRHIIISGKSKVQASCFVELVFLHDCYSPYPDHAEMLVNSDIATPCCHVSASELITQPQQVLRLVKKIALEIWATQASLDFLNTGKPLTNPSQEALSMADGEMKKVDQAWWGWNATSLNKHPWWVHWGNTIMLMYLEAATGNPRHLVAEALAWNQPNKH